MNEVSGATVEVVVEARGEVSARERAYAQEKIDRVLGLAPGPVLFARVGITAHADQPGSGLRSPRRSST